MIATWRALPWACRAVLTAVSVAALGFGRPGRVSAGVVAPTPVTVTDSIENDAASIGEHGDKPAVPAPPLTFTARFIDESGNPLTEYQIAFLYVWVGDGMLHILSVSLEPGLNGVATFTLPDGHETVAVGINDSALIEIGSLAGMKTFRLYSNGFVELVN